MTRNAIRDIMVRVLGEIAPECDASALSAEASLRDALDLDSMDFQRFVVRLHEELRVEIPVRDYPQFTTLAGGVEYLTKHAVPDAAG